MFSLITSRKSDYTHQIKVPLLTVTFFVKVSQHGSSIITIYRQNCLTRSSMKKKHPGLSRLTVPSGWNVTKTFV